MKKKILLTLLTIGFTSQLTFSQQYIEMIDVGTYSVDEIIDSATTYFNQNGTGPGTGYKQFKRWEYMAHRLKNEDGYLKTAKEKLKFFIVEKDEQGSVNVNRESLPDNWQEIGPTNWGMPTNWSPGVGRVTGISIDETNTDHILLGANTGGVWKTTDGGVSWLPLTDDFINMEVYSVSIDPFNSNIYYFGSTNGLIFKSIDSGNSWNLWTTIGNSKVNKIKFHPTNPNIIFASAENSGFYRSLDGGITWNQLSTTDRAYDIEFKPGNPSIVYISGTNFYKSVDGGLTFNVVTGFGFNSHKMIGVSGDDPNVVYVLEAWFGGDFRALYKSTDSGATFIELNHTQDFLGDSYTGNFGGSQAPRDMDIAINPMDADEVHIGGINTWRSMDGGTTFICTGYRDRTFAQSQNIGYCHADIDIMEFAGGSLYLGTDGGIFKATFPSGLNSNFYEDLTNGIGIQQIYKIGVAQLSNELITTGSQDNGSNLYNSTITDWRKWLGSDGMEGFIDKDNSDIMYGTTQFGSLYRTEDAGNSIIDITEPGPGEGNWVSPFAQDPLLPNTIYVGYDAVYKSNDKGLSWSQISQNFASNLSTLTIAPSNNQVMYTTINGVIYRTLDGGLSDWEVVTLPLSTYVHSVAIHPTDHNKIAISGESNIAKVFVSTDGGANWDNYTYNLPVWNNGLSIVWDDNGANGLYLGMESGIYYIDHTLSDWQEYNTNLPNVIINELEINSETKTLYAGTYGRGLWSSPMVEPALAASCQDITVQLDSSGNATIQASDVNNGSVGNFFSIDISSFSCLDIGSPVTVTLTVTDNNGNSASCTSLVTVVDLLPPVLSCPDDQTVAVEALYSLPDYISNGEVSAQDNCTSPVVNLTQNPVPGTLLGFGVHTIEFTATDVYGNTSDPCSFELTIEEILNAVDKTLPNDIVIVPNPVKNGFELINSQALFIEQLEIFDISGRLVLNKQIESSNTNINIEIGFLTPGSYIVEMKLSDGQLIKYLLKE